MPDLLDILQKHSPNQVFHGDDPSLGVVRVPTKIPALDFLLRGGLPRRRMSMIVGDQGTAKTLVIYKMISGFQQQGLSCVYIDAEQVWDPIWAEMNGIDVSDVIVSQPPSGETAIDIVSAALEAEVDFIAVDSIPFLQPAAVIQDEAEQIRVGALSRLLSPSIVRWRVKNTNSCLVFVNQVRDSIGERFPQDRMPGGKMLHFAQSLIIKNRRAGGINEKGEAVGFGLKHVIEKTKLPGVRPRTQVEIGVRFDGTLDQLDALVDMGKQLGVIKRLNNIAYEFEGEEIRTNDGLRQYFSDPVAQTRLIEVSSTWNGALPEADITTEDSAPTVDQSTEG